MMKEITLYDVLGVLAPGTVITVGLVTLYPELTTIITRKEFTIGDFGLIVLVSYVAGNLVAAVGHFIEMPLWKIRGGSPTDRARIDSSGILSKREQDAVQDKLRQLKMIGDDETIAKLKSNDWWSIARRIYTYVEARGVTRRIDLFNAQYGMNRGIAAGFFVLLLIMLFRSGISSWRIEGVLAACVGLSLYRMNRFSRYYATELFRQFLIAP